MKMFALLGAAALAMGGMAAAPAEAQYHHGYHHGFHHNRGHYRYHHRWHGHHRRVVCNRFGHCHRIW